MDKHVFTSGASSSEVAHDWFSTLTHNPFSNIEGWIDREVADRVVKRFCEGAAKHGLDNWRKGLNDPKWIRDRFNHLIGHLLHANQPEWAVRESDREDDLAAAAWGVLALMHAKANYPEAYKKAFQCPENPAPSAEASTLP